LLHVLQPIWLLASAGIIVPLAIHLWNVKEGKTLKVGSVEFLVRTAQQRARSLRLTELFLLFLRCLLILLLALLLSKPYWQNTAKQKGWIVMQEKNAAKTYTAFKPLVDSLLQAGYAFHLFETGFAESDIKKIVAATTDTVRSSPVSYWRLVEMLDRQLLPGMPVYLFTDSKLTHFDGEKPAINIALTWKTMAAGDSVHAFVAEAYETNNDSIAVVMGGSASAGTGYHLQMLGINQPRQKEFTISVSEGRMEVAYQNGQPVIVDTSTLRVAVFSDRLTDDAPYVQAAVQSVQQVTGRKILFTAISKTQDLLATQDWLFWLSEQAIPAQLNAAHVLAYARGKSVAGESWIQENSMDLQDKTALYQRIPYNPRNGIVLWRDGFGIPLLVKEQGEGKQVYDCYLHFNPSWTELVWSPSFPQVIYRLLREDAAWKTGSDDRRLIDAAQLQFPVTPSIKKTVLQDTVDTTGTKRVLWSLIFILFVIERYFSYRVKKVNADA
jgi:hypothetical protein